MPPATPCCDYIYWNLSTPLTSEWISSERLSAPKCVRGVCGFLPAMGFDRGPPVVQAYVLSATDCVICDMVVYLGSAACVSRSINCL